MADVGRREHDQHDLAHDAQHHEERLAALCALDPAMAVQLEPSLESSAFQYQKLPTVAVPLMVHQPERAPATICSMRTVLLGQEAVSNGDNSKIKIAERNFWFVASILASGSISIFFHLLIALPHSELPIYLQIILVSLFGIFSTCF